MFGIIRKKPTHALIMLGTGLLWGIVEFVALQRAAAAGRRLHKH